MIKVYKLKEILKLVMVTILTIILILISKSKFSTPKAIQTSNNNNSYKILVDVEDSKLFLFENEELQKYMGFEEID